MYKYPNKKVIKDTKTKTLQANQTVIGNIKRGMDLENLINLSNQYYIDNNIAFIYKKPTPIKINKVDYINNFGKKKHKIVDAYFSEKSTTDYNGLYDGMYIDFEAKQTKYKSFNVVANLHDHQRKHLSNILTHGGLAFLFVYW